MFEKLDSCANTIRIARWSDSIYRSRIKMSMSICLYADGFTYIDWCFAARHIRL